MTEQVERYTANVFLPGCLGPVKREVVLEGDHDGAVRALHQQVEGLRSGLLDPEAVLVGMLRGDIAKLSPRGIAKVYGQVLNGEDAQHVEIARLHAELEAARGLLSGLISAVRSINCTPRHAIMIKGDDEPCFWQRREWVEYVLGLCTEAEAAFTATTAQEVQRCPKCESDTAIETRRLDGIEAVALQRILFENHRDARPADVGLMGWAAAVLAKKTEQQEAVHWRAVLSPAEVPRQLNIHEHVVGFTDRRKAEDWIAARLHMDGWHYTLEALYPGPQPAQANRIPAGLYAELEALRTLRDATGMYLQGYMRDEIEDEENCVNVDQHDAACSVKSALDNARALEWKGGAEQRQPNMPVLDEHLRYILGRPNFWCHSLANALRAMGQEIAHKAEEEQAAVIHWLLKAYFEHGPGWREAVEKILAAEREKELAKGGDK